MFLVDIVVSQKIDTMPGAASAAWEWIVFNGKTPVLRHVKPTKLYYFL